MVTSNWQIIGSHEVRFIFTCQNLIKLNLSCFRSISSGHEGPVSSLCFNPSPSSSLLVSVSWDKTLRVWDAVSSAASLTRETINLTADGLAVCFRPDGQQVAVASLDGHISVFDPHQVRNWMRKFFVFVD